VSECATPPGTQTAAAICVPELSEGRGGFRIFVEGDALFDVMIKAIESAQCDIRMESYIFAADEIGARFVAALGQKPARGLLSGCT
jgi:cardiolipin synthase